MNETEQYLQAIGAQVLQQQAADQQQTQPVETQQQRAWRIAAERQMAEQRRTIEAARQREQAFLAQRERQREADDRERSETQEIAWKAEALQQWGAAGNKLEGFDKAWPDILKARQLEAMTLSSDPRMQRIAQLF